MDKILFIFIAEIFIIIQKKMKFKMKKTLNCNRRRKMNSLENSIDFLLWNFLLPFPSCVYFLLYLRNFKVINEVKTVFMNCKNGEVFFYLPSEPGTKTICLFDLNYVFISIIISPLSVGCFFCFHPLAVVIKCWILC